MRGHEPPPAVSREAVLHVAGLCRLALSDEQVETERLRLGAILGYMDRLRSVSPEGAPPVDSPTPSVKRSADLRSDEPGPVLPREVIDAMAPSTWSGYLKVPKIIDGGAPP